MNLSRLLFIGLAVSSILETARILHDVAIPEEPRKSFAGRMADRLSPAPQGQAVQGHASMVSCCGDSQDR